MNYIGEILITDEAIEKYKKINIFRAFQVGSNWDKENMVVKVECVPKDFSFNWSWQDINRLIGFEENITPTSVTADREREGIVLFFKNDHETNICKSLEANGDVFKIGILTSEGFISNIN